MTLIPETALAQAQSGTTLPPLEPPGPAPLPSPAPRRDWAPESRFAMRDDRRDRSPSGPARPEQPMDRPMEQTPGGLPAARFERIARLPEPGHDHTDSLAAEMASLAQRSPDRAMAALTVPGGRIDLPPPAPGDLWADFSIPEPGDLLRLAEQPTPAPDGVIDGMADGVTPRQMVLESPPATLLVASARLDPLLPHRLPLRDGAIPVSAMAAAMADVSLTGFRGLRLFDYSLDGTLAAGGKSPAPVPAMLPTSSVASVAKVQALFSSMDYDLDADMLVPGLFVRRLPADLGSAVPPQPRKGVFVRLVLPHILHANERVLWLRRRAIDLTPDVMAGTVRPEDQAVVAEILEEFRLDTWDLPELLKRADIVPPSLALGQAAEESGWGTSNMALSGNALFGQVMWVRASESGRIERQQRPYDDIAAGVASYIRNINTHGAYAGLRDRRARLRISGREIDGVQLIGHLERYSEKGRRYVDKVRDLIIANALTQYDAARFHPAETATSAAPADPKPAPVADIAAAEGGPANPPGAR